MTVIATLVRDALRVEHVTEAEAPREAVLAAKREQPGPIVLDLRIPGVEKTSVLCAQLRLAAPQAKIVIVTAFDEADPIKRCFAAGADACLLKDTGMIDLRKALQSVVTGHRVIDPRIAQTLATDHVRVLRGETLTVVLTSRGREVLELLAEGCSDRLIAERLFIVETTVKGYVSSLLEKLGAKSGLQAVIHASDHGRL